MTASGSSRGASAFAVAAGLAVGLVSAGGLYYLYYKRKHYNAENVGPTKEQAELHMQRLPDEESASSAISNGTHTQSLGARGAAGDEYAGPRGDVSSCHGVSDPHEPPEVLPEVGGSKTEGEPLFAWVERFDEVGIVTVCDTTTTSKQVHFRPSTYGVSLRVGDLVVLDGALMGPIKPDDCYWGFEALENAPGKKALTVTLVKAASTHWTTLFKEQAAPPPMNAMPG